MWPYDYLGSTQQALLDRGIVVIGGDIDESTGRYINECLLRLRAKGAPPFTLQITSGGGEVGTGLTVYDFLRTYEGEITALVQGFAHSMSAVLIQACTHRHMVRHAKMVIHHVSRRNISLDDLRSRVRTRKIREGLEADQRRLYEILAGRTKQSVERIRAQCALDVAMTAEEALDFGLIDQII